MARSGGSYVLEKGKPRKVSGTSPAPRGPLQKVRPPVISNTTDTDQKPKPTASSEAAKPNEAKS